MKQITIANQLYNVHSPSMFCLARSPLWLGFNGKTWQIGYFGHCATWGTREFPSREAAGAVVAKAFNDAYAVGEGRS